MSICIRVLIGLRNLLLMLPLSVRRFIVKTTLSSPLWLSRLLLNTVTKPIGNERKWIHKIEQNTWEGVWIVPNLNSLEQAEDAASKSDLVVLYTHGNCLMDGFCCMRIMTEVRDILLGGFC